MRKMSVTLDWKHLSLVPGSTAMKTSSILAEMFAASVYCSGMSDESSERRNLRILSSSKGRLSCRSDDGVRVSSYGGLSSLASSCAYPDHDDGELNLIAL